MWARLGGFDSSVNILRQAMRVAEDCGALTQAGLAALTLIEEYGATGRLPESEDKERLLACPMIVVKSLSGMELYDKNFSFCGAVHELEARLVEQALESEGGSVSRAAFVSGEANSNVCGGRARKFRNNFVDSPGLLL